MPKKQWYTIYLQDTRTGETQKIATVKSPGLTQHIMKKLEEVYNRTHDQLIVS